MGFAFMGIIPEPTGRGTRSAAISPAAQQISVTSGTLRQLASYQMTPPSTFGMRDIYAASTGAAQAAAMGDQNAMAGLAAAHAATQAEGGPIMTEIEHEEGVTQVTKDQVRGFYLNYYGQVGHQLGVF
jgi:hypothetical protein